MRFRVEAGGLSMRLAQAGTMFLISVALARGLGPEGFGIFSYVQAWILLAATICQLGLPVLLVREVSASRQRDQHGRLRGLLAMADRMTLVAAAAAALLLLTLALPGWSGRPDLATLAVGLPVVFLMAKMMVNEAVTRGFGHVLLGQVNQLVVRPGAQLVLLAVLLLLPFAPRMTPLLAMATLTASALAGFLVSAVVRARRVATLRPEVAEPDLASWRPSVLRLSAIGAMDTLGVLTGTLLLGALSTPAETGFFMVATQVATLISMGLIVINAQQAPGLATAHAAGDRAHLQRLATRACRFGLAVALPLGLPALFAGAAVLSLFYGESFAAAAPALAILAAGQLVNSGLGSVATLLVAAHLENHALLWRAISLLTQVVLSIVLIPDYGAMGAAWATMIGLCLMKLALLAVAYGRLGIVSLPVGALPRAGA